MSEPKDDPTKNFSDKGKERYHTIVEAWKRFLQDENTTTMWENLEGLDMRAFVTGTVRESVFCMVKYCDSPTKADDFTPRHWDRCFIMLVFSLFLDEKKDREASEANEWKKNILEKIGAGQETRDQWPDEEYEIAVTLDESVLMDYYNVHPLTGKPTINDMQ